MTEQIRFDPHVHTAASYDSDAPVASVLDRAAAAGLDALAITDHDTMRGVRRAREYAAAHEVTVVPGVEVSTAAGHLLALGVEDRPEPGRSLGDTVAAVRDQGGAAVVPHPFQRSRHGVARSAMVDCDGLEVYNAMAMTGLQNRRARAFATAEDFPMLGGSDAHVADSVGRAFTEVAVAGETPLTADQVVAAVRAGRTTFGGDRTSLGRYLRKTLYNARLHTTGRLVPWRSSGGP
jgi:predicted metal-dependent phosphoesterase TrpH